MEHGGGGGGGGNGGRRRKQCCLLRDYVMSLLFARDFLKHLAPARQPNKIVIRYNKIKSGSSGVKAPTGRTEVQPPSVGE